MSNLHELNAMEQVGLNKKSKGVLAKVSLVVALAIAGGGGGNLLAAPEKVSGNLAANALSQTHNKEELDFQKDATFTDNQTLGDKTTSITNNADNIGGAGGDKTLTIAKDNANDISITNKSTTANKGWNAALTHNGSGILTITNGSNETEAAQWTKGVTQSKAAGEGTGKISITNAEAATWTGAVTVGNGGVDINNKGVFKGAVTTAAGATTIYNSKTWGSSATDAEIKHEGAGATTINNSKDGEIKSNITSKDQTDTGTLTINNNGTIAKAVVITGNKASSLVITNGVAGIVEGEAINEKAEIGANINVGENGGIITNNAIISGKITGGTGTGEKATTINNNKGGSITGGIAAGAGKLHIVNEGSITDGSNSNKIESAANAEVVIDNRVGGTISAAIDLSAGAGLATITNSGAIDGAITLKGLAAANSDPAKYATLTNNASGVIKKAITATDGHTNINNAGTIESTINLTGKNSTLTNSGTIKDNVTFTGTAGAAQETNTLNNSGAISKVTTATGGTLHITGGVGGVIDNITIADKTTVQLGSGYAVDISSDRKKADGKDWAYDTDGAINVTLSGNGSKLEIGSANARAGEKAFVIADMDIGKAYDLNNFIKNTNNATSTGIATQQIAQNIGFTNNLYSAAFDANGIMTISVEANKSIGALGAIQTIASMNSQINRATNIIDSVFDSVATGEIGTFNYPREGAISNPYIGVGKKSKLDELAEAVEAEKDPKAKEEKLALLLAEKEKANKAWIGFVTPYFSSSSISATGFAATSGQSFGFVGGAAKLLDNGVMFGAHLGVESSNAGKVGQEMQSQGSSFMLGAHAKAPLGNIEKGSLAIIPFVKVQANAMMAINSYRLTPLLDTTREASGLVSGFSGSAVFGIDMPASFGYITPEIGLMAQAINMPSLTYATFNTAANNQVISATTATPLYMLAQVRYTKAIKLEKMSLFPTFKAGMRYAVMGNTFTSAVVLQNSNYFATNNIDSFVGVIEAGLGAKLGQNASVNLSYGGEFGSQVKTHNISVRAGWQF